MILLWLDDKRNPINFIDKYNLSAFINSGEIVWVKSYDEFVDYIKNFGLPNTIAFDHDLGYITPETEKTGYDCAKWLVEYCMDNDLYLPKWFTQSDNPARENINIYLKNYNKHTKKND